MKPLQWVGTIFGRAEASDIENEAKKWRSVREDEGGLPLHGGGCTIARFGEPEPVALLVYAGGRFDPTAKADDRTIGGGRPLQVPI